MKINKKGVSIVVLVITIIVMIILSSITVLIINGENIIGSSNEAIEKVNMSSLKEAAENEYLRWKIEKRMNETTLNADAYVKGILSKEEFTKEQLEELVVLEDGTIIIADNINPITQITLSSTIVDIQSNITAKVEQTDDKGIDITKCKWILTTESQALGTSSTSYTETFANASDNILISSEAAGEYYLHVLTVDYSGNRIETISEKITVTDEVSYNTNEVNTVVW